MSTCQGCANAADPNGKWARCVQCMTKLEAEVARLTTENVKLRGWLFEAFGPIKAFLDHESKPAEGT